MDFAVKRVGARILRFATSASLRIALVAVCIVAVALPFGVANAARRPHSYPGLGREAIASMFAHGDLDAAKGMLSDDWTLDRFSSVHLASPLTWTEDPCNDPYWRFQFYGLRPLQDLLYAFYDTADSAYRDKLFEILRS